MSAPPNQPGGTSQALRAIFAGVGVVVTAIVNLTIAIAAFIAEGANTTPAPPNSALGHPNTTSAMQSSLEAVESIPRTPRLRRTGRNRRAAQAQDRFYAVTVGREVGVFQGWDMIGPLVTGVSGAQFFGVDTEASGWAIYNTALSRGEVHIVMD